MSRTYKLLIQITLSLFVFCGAISNGYAEEDNYYLSQMKKMSKSSKPTASGLEETQKDDLLADVDLEKLRNQKAKLAEVENVKPKFEKPALPSFKPQL